MSKFNFFVFSIKVFGNTSDWKIPPCLSKFCSLGSNFNLGHKNVWRALIRSNLYIKILFYHDLVPCGLLHANKWKIGSRRETVVQKGQCTNWGTGRNLTPLRVNLTFLYFSIKVFGNTSDWKIPPCLSKFCSLGSHFNLGRKNVWRALIRSNLYLKILFYHDLVPCGLLHANKWKIGSRRETVVQKGQCTNWGHRA